MTEKADFGPSPKCFAVIFNISKYGLRPDEISKITLRDLDLERGELTVRTSKLEMRGPFDSNLKLKI